MQKGGVVRGRAALFKRLLKIPPACLIVPGGWMVGAFAWRWDFGSPLPMALGPEQLVGHWLDGKWDFKREINDGEMKEIIEDFRLMRAIEFELEFPHAAEELARHWVSGR